MVEHGFRKIVFINGHGGNIASIQVAFAKLKAKHTQGIFQVISWYTLPGVSELCTEFYQNNDGEHATASEVAVTKSNRPQVFKNMPSEAVQIERPDFSWPLSAKEFKDTFPDGRMFSAPWLATKEQGQQITDVAVNALIKELS